MKRTILGALALVMATTACKDMGLDGNIPLDQAEYRSPGPLVEAVHQETEPGPRLVVNGRLWVATGQPQQIDPEGLQPVGSGDGHTVHARNWDQPPFDALFIQVEDEMATGADWQELAPVRGRTGPIPGSGNTAGDH